MRKNNRTLKVYGMSNNNRYHDKENEHIDFINL